MVHIRTYAEAGTRAIPLVVKTSVVEEAVRIAEEVRSKGIIEVREIRKPKAGVVITGNEVYYGRIKDAFAPIITRKIEVIGGKMVGTYYAPDDMSTIEDRLMELKMPAQICSSQPAACQLILMM